MRIFQARGLLHFDQYVAVARELDRVRGQVVEDLPEPARIPHHHPGDIGLDGDPKLQPLLGGPDVDDVHGAVDDLEEVEGDLFQLHLPRLYLREIEDAVDDGQ